MTRTRSSWLLLGMIIIAGGALRLVSLDWAPPGLWFDEALNAQDALATARGGGLHLVYADEFPREPIFVILLSVAVRWIGSDPVILRATSAAIGLATIVALYFCVLAFADRRLALLAAAVLATMRWHVIFSRLLFRSLLLPLWITLIVWNAAELRRSPKIWKAIALGMLIGSGFYTYLAWYFMLPGVAALLVWVFRGIASNRDLKRCAVSCSIALIVTSSPILLHYALEPDHFLSRPGAVSPFKDGAGAAVRELSKNLLQASGMFHYRGDHVPKHNLPGAPALDRISGIVFLLGLGSCLYRLARRRYGGAERCALETILVSWLLLGMMPTIFAKTDSPNFLRTLVLTPAVAGLIAIGLSELWDPLDRWIGAAKKIPQGLQDAPRARASPLIAILIGALVLTSGATTVRDVFGRWAPSPEVWMSFNGRETQLGEIAGATPPGTICWIPAAMGSHRTVQYLTAGTDRVRLYSDFDFLRPGLDGSDPDVSGPMRVVATEHNVLLPVLRRLVPSGRVIDVMFEPRGESLQPWAWLFEIPPGQRPSAEEVDRAEGRHRIEIGPIDIGW